MSIFVNVLFSLTKLTGSVSHIASSLKCSSSPGSKALHILYEDMLHIRTDTHQHQQRLIRQFYELQVVVKVSRRSTHRKTEETKLENV